MRLLDAAADPRSRGPLPALSRDALVDRVDRAGLVGHGGGGFPLATKLLAVGPRPVVVANGMEGEPLSGKDRVLLARSPGLVFDGLFLLGRALDAARLVLAVGPEVDVGPLVAAAPPGLEVRALAGGFVAGQETALVNALDGRPAVPRDPRVRVLTRGVGGRPTLVSNVETLAQLARLVRLGSDPGTSLFTVSGDVRAPGVVEARRDAPLGEILDASGPLAPVAVLAGGYHGAWTTDLARPLERRGAGVLHVLGPDRCPLAVAAEAARFLADASARQCGPCVNGLPRMADGLSRLATGAHDPATVVDLARMRQLVTGRGACAHPDGTARLVASTLTVFADHVGAHLYGACPTSLRRAS